jgi:hypothetical protein
MLRVGRVIVSRKIIYVDTERGLTNADGLPLNEKQLQALAVIALRGAQRLNAELDLEKSLSPTPETSPVRPCVWRTGCKNPEACDKQGVCVPRGEDADIVMAKVRQHFDERRAPETKVCTCGVPAQGGVTHRNDGPCYVTSQNRGANDAK